MQYKILVQFHIPEIEEEYEAYIPINKTIGEVITASNPRKIQHLCRR